jgi:hypothetical protein
MEYDSYLMAIIKDIKSGKLKRDDDETGSNGFWDYAGEIASVVYEPLETNATAFKYQNKQDDLQEFLYNEFYAIVEICLKLESDKK